MFQRQPLLAMQIASLQQTSVISLKPPSSNTVEVIHPDRYIVNQWDLEPMVAISSFKRMCARRKRPQSSAEEFAMVLGQNELPMNAQRIREASDLIYPPNTA
jgi:hypothetical protein